MHPQLASPNRVSPALIILLISIPCALFFGLIAVTTNPVLIGFSVVLIIGIAFLTKPDWIIWLILSLGLLVTGILPFFIHETLAARSAWSVSILGFFLLCVALLKLLSTPNMQKETPSFVWIALLFFIYAIVCSLVNWHSTDEFLGGVKRYFQMWGLILVLCWLTLDAQTIQRWRIFFVFTALVQLPLVIYQLIVWVPFRESIKNAYTTQIVPIDVVAGTFGSSITGGGASGEMAAFLIIVLVFLLARLREGLITSWKLLIIAPFIMAPLFLGETKVVLLLLPFAVIMLYRWELIARPLYGLLIVILGTLLMVTLGYVYINLTVADNFYELIEGTLDYNIYERGYGGNYLNRTTVLTFWAERQGFHDPISFMFGNGLGSSHIRTAGHVAMQYPLHGIGLTAASTLLWDLGLFGFGLFIIIHILAWYCAGRLRQESTLPEMRADAAAIQVALSVFVFYLFYRISVLEQLGYQIVFTMLLGYLAWMWRRHSHRKADSHT